MRNVPELANMRENLSPGFLAASRKNAIFRVYPENAKSQLMFDAKFEIYTKSAYIRRKVHIFFILEMHSRVFSFEKQDSKQSTKTAEILVN